MIRFTARERAYARAVGLALRKRREACGLNQKEAGQLVPKAHRGHYNEIERGRRPATLGRLAMWSELFGARASDVLRDAEEIMTCWTPERQGLEAAE
jgi:transcriptional regulator with XRE-family HTH domain